MKRDITRLADRALDLLVIGGGILGACVTWDATLRGLRVALVEQEDFAAGASSNNLKILHGGLRDLQSLDVSRCRRNILERSRWFRIAPHLVDPLSVIIPCFKRGVQRKAILRPALMLNDIIGWDRNAGLGEDRRIPRSRSLDRDQVLRMVPEFKPLDVTGGVVFHDGLMWSPERIVLAVVRAAAQHGALVINHAGVERGNRSAGADGAEWIVRDLLAGTPVRVRPRAIVNAAGGNGSAVAQSLNPGSGSLGSFALAMNLVLRSRGHEVAFALPGEPRQSQGVLSLSARQLFVVPWRDRLMIGTGHYPLPAGAEPGEVAHARSRDFLALINRVWPGDPFSDDEIALVHWGVLPSPDSVDGKGPRPLKGPRIVEAPRPHPDDPIFLSAVTAKFTEARLTAERVVDRLMQRLGQPAAPCQTHRTKLPGAPLESLGRLEAQAVEKAGPTLPPQTVRDLVRSYGTEYEEVLGYRARFPGWETPVAEGETTILAQWAYAVDQEMACTPEDLVRRRTDLGARGFSSPKLLAKARAFLAERSADGH